MLCWTPADLVMAVGAHLWRLAANAIPPRYRTKGNQGSRHVTNLADVAPSTDTLEANSAKRRVKWGTCICAVSVAPVIGMR